MAGLWCVNIGYGRRSWPTPPTGRCSTCPITTPSSRPRRWRRRGWRKASPTSCPSASSMSSSSITAPKPTTRIVRFVRHYWTLKGKPYRTQIIGRRRGYHGSTMVCGFARRHGTHARPRRSAASRFRSRAAAELVRVRRRSDAGRVRPGGGRRAREEDPRARPRQCRRLHRRADPGRRRGHHSAAELLAGGRKDLPQIRHTDRCRRGDLRLRPHRPLVGLRDHGVQPRYRRHGQGAVLGLSADRRDGGRRSPHRRILRQGRRILPWLHLFRASGCLRGGAREHPHHEGRGRSSSAAG